MPYFFLKRLRREKKSLIALFPFRGSSTSGEGKRKREGKTNAAITTKGRTHYLSGEKKLAGREQGGGMV